jgi:hypothetical protein
MNTLFPSDLHLSAATPRTCERFIDWLGAHAHLARDLWILGDLFEVWVGDDTLDDPKTKSNGLSRSCARCELSAPRMMELPLAKSTLIRGRSRFSAWRAFCPIRLAHDCY